MKTLFIFSLVSLYSFSFTLDLEATCIEKFKNHLEINDSIVTKPKLIRDILSRDMMLIDQTDVQLLMNKALNVSIPLRDMIVEIESSIERRHPAVKEFLCQSIKNNLIPKPTHSQKMAIERALHHTYILEKITLLMRSDWNAMERIAEHLMGKRRELGLDSNLDILLETKQFFMPAKIISMDVAMNRFKSTRGIGTFSEENQTKTKLGLKINIYEAMMTDLSAGYYDNVLVGKKLAEQMPEKVEIVGEQRLIKYYLKDYWMPLYETWNLAFITANLTALEILYPKLLIPSVINAKNDDYIFSRGLSLWLTTNFYLFKIQRSEDRPIKNASELGKLWGSINLKYIP